MDTLQNDARSLSLADVAARIKTINDATDDASRLGKEFNPQDFTIFLADKPAPKKLVKLRKYALPAEMKKIYKQAISRAKKGMAAGPDGVPMEFLQIFSAAFAELLFELFAAGARLKCLIKDWDVSILIPIYKQKRL